MNQATALYQFFSQFGIDAYAAQAVPYDVSLPYLTYTPAFGTINNPVSCTVNVWYETESELKVFNKIEEIAKRIKATPIFAKDGFAMRLSVDDGYGQDIPQELSTGLKGKTMNISIEYIII